MAQITNAQLVNNLKPYFATRRELQEIIVGGSGGVITEIVPGTAITGGGSTGIVSIAHDTGDFGDLHTNYAEHDQQETISDIWTHTADLQISGADLTFVGTRTIQTNASSSLSITPDQNLTLDPTSGDIFLDPGGDDILPVTNYELNLGALNKKYLTLHAAELWVETLVAQDTIATIGGRILVGPTTMLASDLGSGATSMSVEHNQMAVGDIVYMEASGKVEFMLVIAGPTGVGPYSYTVTRDLDGGGANDWYAGDAILNTGKGGDGFIDLYSVSGLADASAFGPTIVGNVRGYPANLAANPGFEQAGVGGADIWYSWNEGAGSGALADEITLVHSGSHACKASYVTGQASLYNVHQVTPSSTYIFSFWTRGDGFVDGQYAIYDLSNFSYIISPASTGVSGTTYTQVVVKYTVPANCYSIKFELYSPTSSGDAYFDDVEAFLLDYNGWTEHWAIGNLNGLYGYGADTYGVGLGRPDKSHILIDDTNGFRVRDQNSVTLIQLDISGNATFGNVNDNEANVFWNNTTNRLEFRGSTSGTTVQAYIDTDGAIVAGSVADRDVTLDQDGITFDVGTTYSEGKAVTWRSGANIIAEMWGIHNFGAAVQQVFMSTRGYENFGYAYVQGVGNVAGAARLTGGVEGGTTVSLVAEYDSIGSGILWPYSTGSFAVNNGLHVGDYGTPPEDNNITCDGIIKADDDVRTAQGMYLGSISGDPGGTGWLYATGRIRTAQGLNAIGIYVGNTTTAPTTNEIRTTGHVRVGGGLFVGSDTGSAKDNDIVLEGGIGNGKSWFSPTPGELMWDCRWASDAGMRPWDGGTYHEAYVYVPFPDTVSYVEAGNLTGSATGTAILWPSGIPSEARAIACYLDLSCTAANSWVSIGPANSGSGLYQLICRVETANRYNANNGIVAVNAATKRRMYRSHNAKGGTITYYLRATGVFL